MLLVVAPVEVGVQVLGLLQGMGDGALGDPQPLAQQGGHQVAVRVLRQVDLEQPEAQPIIVVQGGQGVKIGQAVQASSGTGDAGRRRG